MYSGNLTRTPAEREKSAIAPPSLAQFAVDLRSDTVTRPTPEMREAMFQAVVGDDVYGEDPTVNLLQSRAAEIFGREAALFVPSGSMGNLIAIQVWARHGHEVICEERGHIHQYEMGSISAIAGCMPRTTYVDDGILTWERYRTASASQKPLRRANRAHQPGKFAQHGWRHGVPVRGRGGNLRPGARAWTTGAPGRRAHLQCRGSAGPRRRRTDPQIRFRDVLPV